LSYRYEVVVAPTNLVTLRPNGSYWKLAAVPLVIEARAFLGKFFERAFFHKEIGLDIDMV